MDQSDITMETIKDVDLKKLALNKDFGRLDFKNSLKEMLDLQSLFVEFDELNFQDTLTPEEVSNINNHKKRFVDLLNRLKNFDIGMPNSQQEHDNIAQELINHNNNVQKSFRTQLVFLRQQAAKESQDVAELQRLQKEAVQTKQEYQKLADQLSLQLENLEKQKESIAERKGEVAALAFGKHFESTAKDYEKIAEQRWYKLGRIFFIILAGIVIVNFLSYLTIFIGSKVQWWKMEPKDIFTLEYAIVKIALLLLLSYVVGIASKQYSINSHLAALNNHRKNVAETLKDFYESDFDAAAKSSIINKGTEAMFENLPIGHISKSEGKDSDGPIHQIINQLPKINGK